METAEGEEERGHYAQSNKKQCQWYNCKSYGHFSYECYNKPQNIVTEESNFPEEDRDAQSRVLLKYKWEENNNNVIWSLDIGANNHVCNQRVLH